MRPHRFPPGRRRDCESPAGHFPVGMTMTLLLALAATEVARADCPASTVIAYSAYGGTASNTSSQPRDGASRSSYGTSCSDWCYSWSENSSAEYDLVAGTMSAEVYTGGGGHGESSAFTHDVFTLLGPAAA